MSNLKIGLHDADNTNYPNLALMKLSAYYKNHNVSWYEPLLAKSYDMVFSSNEQKRIARWVNHKAIFKSVSYEKYAA